MANFDEMLAALHGDSEGDALSDVVGADKAPRITVTAARAFEFDEGFDKVIAYEGDVNSQIITFILPELHEGHSLSECGNKKVRWINQGSKVEGTSVLTPGAEANEYEWNVPPALFAKSGTIEFSIVVYDLDADNKVGFSWNTAPCTALSVGKSIESVGGIGDMPAQSEILIIDEDSKTIIAPVGYNPTIANSGDKNTSVVYFQTKRYIKGIDLIEHTAAAPVVHISYVLDDGGKRTTGSGSIEVVPYTSQYDGITNELVLIIWRPEAGLTADSLFYGSFQTLVSFEKDEKVWNSAPYKELRIGKPLDYTDNPGGTFAPQLSYKFLGKDYSNKGNAVEISAIIAHQVHTEAEWRELEYVPENGEVVYSTKDGIYYQKVGNGLDKVEDLPVFDLLVSGSGKYSIQMLELSEATGINAVALGGLNYEYVTYKYAWEFSVQLPNSRYSTHYGYYYKNTEGEYAAVSSADSTNIADQQIVEGGKYITPFGDGNAEYTTSLTSAVVAEDGTIVSAPVITFTDAEGTVYTADMVESPYLGRVKTTAAGNQSFAAGGSTYAHGDWSVAFGKDTAAYQKASFAEGGGTIAGDPEGEDTYSFAHAEGEATKAIGRSSHSEGSNTQATGAQAHAENYKTIASGQHSHAEGSETNSTNKASHAEGYKTTASGTYSHAEGNTTEATKTGAHAEGNNTHATNQQAHAEGQNTTASGSNSHAEGYKTSASGESAHTEGLNTKAIGNGSHAEGYLGETSGLYSHAEGQSGKAKANYSHVEGDANTVEEAAEAAHAEGKSNTVSGAMAHAEGYSNTVSGEAAHAEGHGNTVSGVQSHAEGYSNKISGAYSHAEGKSNIVKGNSSHAGGSSNQVHGNYSRAVGDANIIYAGTAFAFGASNIIGQEGKTVGGYSFVTGQGNKAIGWHQSIRGKWCLPNSNFLEIVGNGDADVADPNEGKKGRSNAYTLDREGNAIFAGTVTAAAPTQASHLARKGYVDTEIAKTLTSAKSYTDQQINALNIAQYTTEQEVKNIIDKVILDAADSETYNSLTKLVDYLDTHGAEAARMSGAITVLEGRADELQGKIKNIDTDIISLRSVDSSLQIDIDTIKTKIDDLEEVDKGLQTDIGTINTNISNLETNLQDQIDGINTDIDKLRADFVKAGNLPTVTTANNGQFLRVVDGVWTAVTIPQAEGGSF